MAAKICVILAILCLIWFSLIQGIEGRDCSSPRLPQHVTLERIPSLYATEDKYPEGTVIAFACDAGYTLFGSKNSTCSSGQWLEKTPRCFLEVAEGSKSYMSPQADEFMSAQLSTDGDRHTCVPFSSNAARLEWAVDTFQDFRVRVVSIVSQYFLPNSTIEIRVGSHHPSTGAAFNELCTRQKLGFLEDNRREFECESGDIHGRYVSISVSEPGDHHVSFCEVSVYTDSGLSVDDSCPPMNLMYPEKARFVFENKCIKFLGQYDHSEGVFVCTHHGGTLVKPISRALQNFLDFNMKHFYEDALDQDVFSFWVDAQRVDKSNVWVDRNGNEIRGVQVKNETEEKCLVSELRNWHSESCANQHQVICVSEPITCGTPSFPEFSSIRMRSKLPADHFLHFGCETGFRADVESIECFENGTLSKEPTCVAEPRMLSNIYDKVQTFFRSFSMFAHLSAAALNAIIGLFSGMFAALTSALVTCCYCVMKRRKANKTCKTIQRSFLGLPIQLIDLPTSNSSRLFKTPTFDGKVQANVQLESDSKVRY